MTLFTTILLVCGKVNFTNLSRYSDVSERTYRRQYHQSFEFAALNRALIQRTQGGGAMLAVMDCSFVHKSGKATFGLDAFWNGCANRVETGLEVSVVGVVDVETEQGYTVSAEQTYAQASVPECSRMAQYLYHLEEVRPYLPLEVHYLAVDGAYAKASFVSGAMDLKLHVISKLRCDANLQFLYTGVQKRRGRPRKYAGKVDLNDVSRLTFVGTIQPNLGLYTAVVCMSRSNGPFVSPIS